MLNVSVIGHGAIGSVVCQALLCGEVPGTHLVGAVDRTRPPVPPVSALSLPEAIRRADLVVECAGHQALSEAGPAVVAAGKELLVVSTGALIDDELLEQLRSRGPERVHLCSGAIGGLDLLRSATLQAPFDRVLITTSKLPGSLVQPWMTDEEAERVRTATEPVEVLRAPAKEMARRFPRSTNVAASVALAVGAWEIVEARLLADPAATLTCHDIEASGPTGEYRFLIRNRPSVQTPTTSQVVPYAVLRILRDLTSPTFVFR